MKRRTVLIGQQNGESQKSAPLRSLLRHRTPPPQKNATMLEMTSQACIQLGQKRAPDLWDLGLMSVKSGGTSENSKQSRIAH